MSDFILTIDSDNEEPQSELNGRQLTDGAAKAKGKGTTGKGKKRARESETGDGDDVTLSAGFQFDTLGGASLPHLSSKKQFLQASAWDLDNNIDLFRKKNSLPRVTVDEIIARRRKQQSISNQADERRPSESETADNETEPEDNENEVDTDEDEDQSDEDSVPDAGGSDDEEEQPLLESESSSSEADENDVEDATLQEMAEYVSPFTALANAGQSLSDVEDDSENKQDVKAVEYFTAAPLTSTSKITTNDALRSSSLPPFSALPGAKISRPILLGLQSLGLTTPTPVQAQTIPVAMTGKDIVGSSITGSGKTVAFWVGVLERLLYRDKRDSRIRVVVICPTRELAVQVHNVGQGLARYTDIRFCLCVGGLSVKAQEAELKTRPDIVVSTPGRLIDHVRNTPAFTLDALEILIIDEADRILEEGFKDELAEIISSCPHSRQTMLFSATITEDIDSLARVSLRKPVRIAIDAAQSTSANLAQEFVKVRSEPLRQAMLIALCRTQFADGQTVIFFRSKMGAHRFRVLFGLCGLAAEELHGDLTQEQRLTALKRFRDHQVSFLLATDLASRGLDIRGIEGVINYEPPKSFDIYLHRVGRTARAGKAGRAVTLVSEADRKLVRQAAKASAAGAVTQSTLDAELVRATQAEIDGLKDEIKEILAEEKEEKELRRTEMELQKGQNMLDHKEEIYSRPARTWFQTANEKASAKNKGREEYNDKMDTSGVGSRNGGRTSSQAKSLLNHRQRRRQDALKEIAAEKGKGGARVGSAIRTAKRANLPAPVRQLGGDDSYSSRPKPAKAKKKGKKGKSSFNDAPAGKQRTGLKASAKPNTETKSGMRKGPGR